MQRRLGDALGVYVDAMRYPRGTEDQRASMWLEHTRRPGWKAVACVETPACVETSAGVEGPAGVEAPARGQTSAPPEASRAGGRSGPEGSAAGAPELSSAPMLGVAYGYCGAPDQWWQQQVVAGLRRTGTDNDRISELLTSYFELTELHIHPRAQGRGLGEALIRRLLEDRSEQHVLLSTPEINGEANRAWRLYRRLGFTDVIRGYHFSGDPRAFAILGRALPL
ncbi:acetyltransferase [Mycobacterium sp. PO1]|nr:acetyltransferase [Mycobacterium sp. PO1]GFM24849.1 acetyltransferase [Mycobacterium sp. PO2]